MANYIYGKNVVISLLRSNKEIMALYIQQDRKDREIENLATSRGISYKILSRKQMDKLVEGNHQGYIAEVREYRTYSIEELISERDHPERKPLLVALDEIQDPHNLGAVLRTVACVGGDGVIIEKNRSVSLNGTVAKVSVGAIDTVKVAQVTNLVQTLKQLKEAGYWIVGTDVNEAVDYRSLDYDMPVVLVIGSEGKGMRRLVAKECDFRIKLPMENGMNSLNASVACGILLYQIYSQRSPLK